MPDLSSRIKPNFFLLLWVGKSYIKSHQFCSISYCLLFVCNVFMQLIYLLNFNFHQVINKEVFFLHFDRFRVLDSFFSCFWHFSYFLDFRDRIDLSMFYLVWFFDFKKQDFFCNLVFDEHMAMKSYTKIYMYTNSRQFFSLVI